MSRYSQRVQRAATETVTEDALITATKVTAKSDLGVWAYITHLPGGMFATTLHVVGDRPGWGPHERARIAQSSITSSTERRELADVVTEAQAMVVERIDMRRERAAKED